MKMKFLAVVTAGLFICGTSAYAAEEQYPKHVDEDAAVKSSVEKIATNKKVTALINDLKSKSSADARFDLFLELTRIAAPSREEMYRAQAVSVVFQNYIDKYKATSKNAQNARVIYDFNGKIPGAGVQIVDGLPVYNVCMEIKGTYAGKDGYKNTAGEIVRPKILFEGHIDSVNPAHLDGYPNIKNTILPIYVDDVNNSVVQTRDELAKLTPLKFTADGKVDKTDPNYIKAMKRYKSLDEAKADKAYKIYIPSIGDMMLQSVNVLQTAEFLLKHDIRPYYDLWICGTAGEEGRGNLDGMKQLFGYSQDGIVREDGKVAFRGAANNALNFVANLSAEGGATIHYLGSHRYQTAYIGKGGDVKDYAKVPNPLNAVSLATSCIAKLKTPHEDAAVRTKYADLQGDDTRTTFNVGLVYADNSKPYAKGKIPENVSIEVDMRSNNPINVDIMDRQIQECFTYGMLAENKRVGLPEGDPKNIVKEILWYGDRPAYTLTAEAVKKSKYVQAISYANELAYGNKLELKSPKQHSSSVNSNVPAKIGIPTVNMDYGFRAAAGQGHNFNEWAVLGDAELDTQPMARAIYVLLSLTGSEEAGVKPLYNNPVGPRQTDTVFP